MPSAGTTSGTQSSGGGSTHAPTVRDIISDQLTQISLEYWATGSEKKKPFSADLIEEIYKRDLLSKQSNKVMLLELSNYLENYLWPNFDSEKSSFAHVMSIIVMVNEKFRENVTVWHSFRESADKFHLFFNRILQLASTKLSPTEKMFYITFLMNCFQSLEEELLRKECQRLVSLPLWANLSSNRLEKELRTFPKLRKPWKALQKKWNGAGKEEAPKKDEKRVPEPKKGVEEEPEEEEEEPEEEQEAAGKKRRKSATKKTKASKKGAKKVKVKKKAKTTVVEEEVEKEPEVKSANTTTPQKSTNDYEQTFVPTLVKDFFSTLNAINEENAEKSSQDIIYCVRFIEFITDLEAQLPTRRFFHTYMEDLHFVLKCRRSTLYSIGQGSLFKQMVDVLKFYQGFEVNNFTGDALSDNEMEKIHYNKIQSLQHIAFVNFRESLEDFALTTVSAIESREQMTRFLNRLDDVKLYQMGELLCLFPPLKEGEQIPESRDFMLEVIISNYEKRQSQIEVINNTPLYPTETLLWNEGVIPSSSFVGDTPLALPKLNLQFLTFYDYLWRNYNLYRLESAYEIRGDIEDVVRRSAPRIAPGNKVEFGGWSRMGLPIKDFKVTQVANPDLGERKPRRVKADVTITLEYLRGQIKNEWEGVKAHDVLFLISLKPTLAHGQKVDTSKSFPEQFGIQHIRGCEVIEIVDEAGHLLDERDTYAKRKGEKRTYKVLLDCSQYRQDMDDFESKKITEDIYTSFNLVMRRKPKENNFKPVLETLRELMNTKDMVPSWLHDVFLGYGNPSSVVGVTKLKTLDFVDTFLDYDHLVASFPGKKVRLGSKDVEAKRPFLLTFNDEEIIAEPYVRPNPGPYPYDKPKENQIPFSPTQVAAIRTSMDEGLSLIVGPPGTGKTDVAVQIISNWYHNFPNQRILLVTHSNQALNQLFEKIAALDIDERHLLRLGHGQEQLETEEDFSKYGRVNHMLQRRIDLLSEVGRLASSLSILEDVSYTCETATIFYQQHIVTRWEDFKRRVDPTSDSDINDCFPFHDYFKTAPQPLFQGKYAIDLEIAEGCWRHLSKIFTELEESRAFELLLTSYDRSNYLLTKQARIVAMTCTHAALRRPDFLKLGFQYDNLLMEESAQVLDIETFIPMVLYKQEENRPVRKLKRIVLLGDHNQLPPIVQNIALQKYAHLDQSLFARFVRLGVPTIELDFQGRARPSIADLYNWRYKKLENLPSVFTPEFKTANAGFEYDYQFVDVGDYMGRGEIEPNPHFIQNLGEAEYVVATYQYMRLLGYPANKISIITTYNGQKFLIRDVIERRCASSPIFGKPAKVTTVDRFQGQQNDIILLSLVRTKTVGHIRDIRRLVVAMSRARLGLYVFGRRSLFENCYELTNTFSTLLKRPTLLHLAQNETWPATRALTEAPASPFEVPNVDAMLKIVEAATSARLASDAASAAASLAYAETVTPTTDYASAAKENEKGEEMEE